MKIKLISIIITLFLSLYLPNIAATEIIYHIDYSGASGTLAWNGECDEGVIDCFGGGTGCSVSVIITLDDEGVPVLNPNDIWTCSFKLDSVSYDLGGNFCSSTSKSGSNFTFPGGILIEILSCPQFPNIENSKIDISGLTTDNNGYFTVSIPYPSNP